MIQNPKQLAFHIEKLRIETDFKVKSMLKWGEYQWLKCWLHSIEELEDLRATNMDILNFIDSDEYRRGHKRSPADFKD